jgi:hypothetical protein
VLRLCDQALLLLSGIAVDVSLGHCAEGMQFRTEAAVRLGTGMIATGAIASTR